MYQYSYIELFGFFAMVIFVIIGTISKRNIFNSYKLALVLIIIGASSVIISCIFNSLSANRWDRIFIIAFLQLKEVGSWLTRGPAHIGYLLFIWGVTVLFIAKKYQKRKDN